MYVTVLGVCERERIQGACAHVALSYSVSGNMLTNLRGPQGVITKTHTHGYYLEGKKWFIAICTHTYVMGQYVLHL